jgi:alpha/beta superfamily hydrolase
MTIDAPEAVAAASSARTGVHSVLPAVLCVQGAALLGLVLPHGSPGWAVLRAALVVVATILVITGYRRGAPAVRATCLGLAGVAGVSAGAALGVAHVAKAALSVTAVLGLVVLGTGALLIAAGTTTAIRATHRWWRLLAIPVAFVVAQFVLLPVTVAIYATNVPPTVPGSSTPARWGLPYQDVRLRTVDGVDLSAWYIPSTNRAAVVALHGSGSTRPDVLDRAVVLARHGDGVLLPDARGHGRSGGDAMDFGWYGNRDIAAAVSYLAARPDVDPARIGALGMSMGGEQALTAAGADDRIRAVVAEGVTARVAGDAAWRPHNISGLIIRGESLVQYSVCEILGGAPRPVLLRDAVAATAPRPVLIIAGRPPGEIPAARFYRAAAPGSVQVWELPDTGHARGLATDPSAWTARVTAFFDRAMPPGPVP